MKSLTFGTVEDAVGALRAGRPVLVSDSPERENEVDAIVPAASANEKWLAWVIRHSSGYLCAPMPQARADALELPLMVPHSQDPRRTAYTVTVDAAHGVTTGISAADRARTLRVLADPHAQAADLIRPGHVLPLRAVPGGVLHRAGHTEAAVDLCLAAGIEPVAGIAELVNDDGTMMRLEAAAALAGEHDLVLLTIADLIAWRRAQGHRALPAAQASLAPRVRFSGQANLPTAHGMFTIRGYQDLRTGAEHVALVAQRGLGDLPLVRVHSECLTGDAFDSLRCDCGPQLAASASLVAKQGGAIVYLRAHEGRGIGLLAKIDAYALQDRGRDTITANLELGLPADRREYGAAAAILADLGARRIRLLTNNPAKVEGLRSHGIDIAETVGLQVGLNQHNAGYLRTKAVEMGHLLSVDAEDEAGAGPAANRIVEDVS